MLLTECCWGGMTSIRNIVNYCVEYNIAYDLLLSLFGLSCLVTLSERINLITIFKYM